MYALDVCLVLAAYLVSLISAAFKGFFDCLVGWGLVTTDAIFDPFILRRFFSIENVFCRVSLTITAPAGFSYFSDCVSFTAGITMPNCSAWFLITFSWKMSVVVGRSPATLLSI